LADLGLVDLPIGVVVDDGSGAVAADVTYRLEARLAVSDGYMVVVCPATVSFQRQLDVEVRAFVDQCERLVGPARSRRPIRWHFARPVVAERSNTGRILALRTSGGAGL